MKTTFAEAKRIMSFYQNCSIYAGESDLLTKMYQGPPNNFALKCLSREKYLKVENIIITPLDENFEQTAESFRL